MQEDCILNISNSLGIDNVFFLFGAELEFYVLDDDILTLKSDKILDFCEKLNDFVEKNNIAIEGFTKEDGVNQFEIQIQPNDLAIELADNIQKLKHFMSKIINVSFMAKPFSDRPGNGMHFHISLYEEKNEQNLFMKLKDNYQKNLYYAIGGLMKNMKDNICFIATTENCYERYVVTGTKYIQNPTSYSWGFNNRTCAIRVPQNTLCTPQNTRIEYRLPSSFSDPVKCLELIISDICEGIINKIVPIDPIFGNAFDDQYSYLEKIVIN